MSGHAPDFLSGVRADVETNLERPLTYDEFANMYHKVNTVDCREKTVLEDANFVIGDALFRSSVNSPKG